MRHRLLLLAAALLPALAPLRAQGRDSLRAGPGLAPASDPDLAVADTSRRPRGRWPRRGATAPRACEPVPWAARAIVEPPAGAAAGAITGWMLFTFGMGALASDHGAEYRETRRRFVSVGALLGAGVGIYHLVTVPSCGPPTERGTTG